MKKPSLSIKSTHFAKIHSIVKKFEAKNGSIKIGKMSLLNFLMANSSFQPIVGESKETRTKRIILQIAGDYSTDPDSLNNSLKLKGNLGYGDDEYTLLQIRLDKLVKEYKKDASVGPTEAGNCAKVGDCVTLVNTKTA